MKKHFILKLKVFLLLSLMMNMVIPDLHAHSLQDKREITGTVTDTEGFPLIGASIAEKETTNGTVTDLDGKFSLSVFPGAILTISYIGYLEQEVQVGQQRTYSIVLVEDTQTLEEVVVVGYGVKKKSVITGAISSLDSEELLQSKPTNVNQALNGRAAGVVVSPVSGQPGSSPKVVIRGVGTNGQSSPLYIVDGLPMSDMNAVNPNDIESMEVLKDATSAAIYGARAANGVILITTKKGKAGTSTLTYDGYYGVQNAYNVPEMANSTQYIQMLKEFRDNDGTEYEEFISALDPSINTDWFDAITQTAPVTEHNITATFGSDKGSTLLSLGYRNQDGIIGGDKSFFKRYSARINTNQKINNYLTAGANMNLLHIDKNSVATGTNGWNPAYYAFHMDPTTPVKAGPGTDYPDYSLYTDRGYGVTNVPHGRMWNPIQFMEVVDANGFNKTDRLYGNAFLQIEPVKNLIIKTDIAANINNNNKRGYSPVYYYSAESENQNSSVTQASNRSTFWQWENTISYTHQFGGHNLSGLLGTSASESTYEWQDGRRQNLPDEAEHNTDYWYLNAGDIDGQTANGGANARHALASVFGRLSYDYQNKYMAEVVVRRDGSTNFGPDNKYAIFPGVSGGWNVSSEDFWNINNFDMLKLRLSWGQNGNQGIDPFSYTSVIANKYYYTLGTGSVILPGSAPTNLVNSDVRWETSEQFNVGADMVFWGSQLRVGLDYYVKTTKDLLLQPVDVTIRGNDMPFYNIAEIANRGFEMQASYNKHWGDFRLSINANASYLKNEVIDVGNDNGYVEGATGHTGGMAITRMEEGKTLGYFHGYKTRGIFQTQEQVDNHKYADGTLIQPDAKPGDLIYQDTNGENGIEADDRVDIGNPWPKWTYGLNINAGYKGLDFSIFMTGKADLDVMALHYRSESYGRANLPAFYLDAWKKSGDNTDIPRLSLADKNKNFSNPSDFFVYDASFLKIGTIELGYTLPQSILNQMRLANVRLYVALDNVAIFTKYPFFDPEVGAMDNDNILTTGLDRSIYPQARTSRVGLTVSF